MRPITVAFVTACTALVATAVGPIITFRIGKAQIAAAVLSSNRQKWIDQFRELVAASCSQAVTAALIRDKVIDEGRLIIPSEPEVLSRLETLMLTFAKIRLMINPLEENHHDPIELLSATMSTLRTAPLKTDLEVDLQDAVDRIVMSAQSISKREWTRVRRGV